MLCNKMWSCILENRTRDHEAISDLSQNLSQLLNYCLSKYDD